MLQATGKSGRIVVHRTGSVQWFVFACTVGILIEKKNITTKKLMQQATSSGLKENWTS